MKIMVRLYILKTCLKFTAIIKMSWVSLKEMEINL